MKCRNDAMIPLFFFLFFRTQLGTLKRTKREVREKLICHVFFRSKLALAESTCRGASIYDLKGTELETDAQRHCQTAKRYFVGINEPFQYDQRWREERQVKNPEWILWFWFPIFFTMYVLMRYIWSLLMDNQGKNHLSFVFL